AHEITLGAKRATRRLIGFAVRCNGASDWTWHKMTGRDGRTLMERFPAVTFYDYTKNPHTMRAFADGKLPANYHVTFSRSERNEAECLEALSRGVNVAVVFDVKRGHALPETYYGRPVLDGDISDLRFRDPRDAQGYVIGLRAKGTARRPEAVASGFVVHCR
ncbi:MAG TPA: hypothetical protein VN903_28685, partial [Polyangia bacterium]|nr:hypothetical protein [Polyangia bacterium]